MSQYLDDLLNIGYVYFEQMVDAFYPKDLQLNKTNTSIPLTQRRRFLI